MSLEPFFYLRIKNLNSSRINVMWSAITSVFGQQKSASSGSYGQADAASSPIGFAGSDGIQGYVPPATQPSRHEHTPQSPPTP